MPVELFLSPILRPVVLAQAVLYHPHRPGSRYIPNIVDIATTGPEAATVHKYTVRREFGTGAKVYDVFDDANGHSEVSQRLYHFERSRAVKGAYKFFTEGVELPTATIRAGLRSNVLMIRHGTDTFHLGWHVLGHRVDAIESYRLFQLADGYTYQWTTKGRYLERVHNLGEKESEVRERVAYVELYGRKGFAVTVDESKVSRELVILTAMISYIDQWNTQLGLGGIYLASQPLQLDWKRD